MALEQRLLTAVKEAAKLLAAIEELGSLDAICCILSKLCCADPLAAAAELDLGQFENGSVQAPKSGSKASPSGKAASASEYANQKVSAFKLQLQLLKDEALKASLDGAVMPSQPWRLLLQTVWSDYEVLVNTLLPGKQVDQIRLDVRYYMQCYYRLTYF